jgi:xanthine dehydrogenase accessory factor
VTIGAAILAAGSSSRLGRPKQLLPYAGATLVETIVARVRATSCTRMAVVLGADREEIARRLARVRVDIVDNDAWQEGMAGSLRVAVAWARAAGCTGLLIAVVDQPRLSTAHLERLLAALRATGDAAASRYSGKLGVPAAFGARWFGELERLQGDRGASGLLERSRVTAIDWADGSIDIDEPADLPHLA